MWKHRLDIDNVVLHILRGYDESTKQHFKEVIIAYKTIYINTYNVIVQEISGREVKGGKNSLYERSEKESNQ
jgi:hypothetical protein